MLCLRVSWGIPENENHSAVLKMITSFSVFQQPLEYIIHFPIRGLIHGKLCLVAQFASSIFSPITLFFPSFKIKPVISVSESCICCLCQYDNLIYSTQKQRPKWLWPWIVSMKESVCFWRIIKWSVLSVFSVEFYCSYPVSQSFLSLALQFAGIWVSQGLPLNKETNAIESTSFSHKVFPPQSIQTSVNWAFLLANSHLSHLQTLVASSSITYSTPQNKHDKCLV